MDGSIAEHVRDLDNLRRGQGRRHGLLKIIMITILGGGLRSGRMDRDRGRGPGQDRLAGTAFFDLSHGILSHDTLGRLFARLAPRHDV